MESTSPIFLKWYWIIYQVRLFLAFLVNFKINSSSYEWKSKSANNGTQLVPIRKPTVCWNTYPTNSRHVYDLALWILNPDCVRSKSRNPVSYNIRINCLWNATLRHIRWYITFNLLGLWVDVHVWCLALPSIALTVIWVFVNWMIQIIGIWNFLGVNSPVMKIVMMIVNSGYFLIAALYSSFLEVWLEPSSFVRTNKERSMIS